MVTTCSLPDRFVSVHAVIDPGLALYSSNISPSQIEDIRIYGQYNSEGVSVSGLGSACLEINNSEVIYQTTFHATRSFSACLRRITVVVVAYAYHFCLCVARGGEVLCALAIQA